MSCCLSDGSLLSPALLAVFVEFIESCAFAHECSLLCKDLLPLSKYLSVAAESLPVVEELGVSLHDDALEKVFLLLSLDNLLADLLTPRYDDRRALFDSLIRFESADALIVILHLLEYRCLHLHLIEEN